MKELNLRLNDRLGSVPLLSDVQSILDQLSYESKSYSSYLENTYPYFINMVKLLKNDYIEDELIIIANAVYFNKGSIQALRNFMNYFKIHGTVTYTRIKLLLDSNIVDTNTTSYEIFLARFREFCNDLLILNTNNTSLQTIVIECTIVNNSEQSIETVLINNLI